MKGSRSSRNRSGRGRPEDVLEPHRRRSIVIVLTGSSSSGKTALAKALQDELSYPALLIEADRGFPDFPARAAAPSPEAVVAFHRGLAVWATAGFDLIVDGSLPYGDRVLAEECLRELEPFDLRVVAVECSVEELRRRERSRPEPRPLGWAERQARDVNEGVRCVARVDTSRRSPRECARELGGSDLLAPR